MKTLMSTAAAALFLSALPALAEILVEDPYIRTSTPNAKTGAAFMVLTNTGPEADRLIGVSAEIAPRVELHTHTSDAMGVMKMHEIEGGIALHAGHSHALARGGDHVMFMGLEAPLEQGGEVTVTLIFEKAGEIEVAVPVDHERKPDHGAKKHDH
jgi:hypothetical protein